MLTPEEKARITELQDLLIERFVERREAAQKGKRNASTQLRQKSTVFCAKRTRSTSGRL
jgi:hypothetical protein